MEAPFSHCKSMGNLLDAQGQSVVSGPIWPKLELVRACMHVLITCKYEKDRTINSREKRGDTIFPIISLWGYFLDV